MASAVVSLLLDQLIPIVLDELKSQVNQVVGARKEIERLKSTFVSIQAALAIAEEKQMVDDLTKISLENLKEVAYDFEDLLDEWRTLVLIRSQVVTIVQQQQFQDNDDADDDDENTTTDLTGGNTTKKKKKVCINNDDSSYNNCLCCPLLCFNKVTLYHSMGCRVKEIREKLDSIKESNQFFKDQHDINNVANRLIHEEPRRSMTSSELSTLYTRGRDFDRHFLVEKLVTPSSGSSGSSSSSSRGGVPVVSIVGMGGLGKTTLAQLVYHDPKVENYFDQRIWVCVSKSFEKTRLAKAIIEAVSKNVPDFFEWDPLHQHLGRIIKEKKFLLVLDDVWDGDSGAWEPLKVSLNGGAEGSKVLVTTRDVRVAEMMGSKKPHHLKELTDNQCWLVLRDIALSGMSDEEIVKLETYGKQIAEKCKGLPLAVKSLGNFMRNKTTEDEWQDILESETWKVPVVKNKVVPALLFSYYALQPNLRQCFRYCAFLPKDYQIEKDVLIKLWMAQGFLGTTLGQTEQLEKIGEDYFDSLVMPSFFQDFKKDDDGNIISCKLHDLVHDLAQSLTENECLFMENTDNNANISCSKALHSTLIFRKDDADANTNPKKNHVDSIPHSFYSAEKLRTLKLFKSRWSSLTLPADLFRYFTRLRALDLSFTDLDKLPDGIENLIHLRYLNLSGTRLEALPDTVCKLYNLQSLMLNDCQELITLPEQIGVLRNLRHLEIQKTPKLCYLPEGIRRLSSLRTLSKFNVVDGREGSNIGELKELDLLKGHLEINGLKRVKNERDVNKAKLEKKRQLYSLCLDFEQDILRKVNEVKTMEGVLEGLKPNPRLKKLEIRRYLGSGFSSWMAMNSHLSNLRILMLKDCKNCRNLPALGKLSALEELRIENMDELELIGHEFYGTGDGDDGSLEKTFPKLKVLHVNGMLKLREWDRRMKGGEGMPCLNHLYLQCCPKLKVLPRNIFPPKLSELYVKDCPELGWETVIPS